MARALSRYCCWEPPHPWTRSVPGLPFPTSAGAINVPSMLSPLTGILIASVLSSMRLHDGVFDQRPGLRVHASKINPRTTRYHGSYCRIGAVRFRRARADRAQARIGAERLERRNFRAARAADSPGLLEHAGMPAAARVAAAQYVVIAPRGEQAAEFGGGGIEHARLADGGAHVLRQRQFFQCVVITAHDDQVRAAVSGLPLVVGGRFLRAAVRSAQAVDAHLADAVSRFLLQARLEH